MGTIRLSKYRWVVLGALMFITMMAQVQWLTHAPIERAAEVYYQEKFNPLSFFNIDFLASSYMIFYLIMCIPASYIIDRYGIVKGVGMGAVLMIAGATIKGFSGNSFTLVMTGQILLAIAQPFVINAPTAVSARWFPVKERAISTGLATLAQYIGILIAMVVTPMLIVSSPSASDYGNGIGSMVRIYGIITITAAVAALLLLKEKPSTPPSEESYERFDFFPGLKHIFKLRDMWIIVLLFTIGLGVFNAISSMVDSIANYIGIDDSNGLLGGLMLIGGIIGAVIIPVLSDLYKKRKLFLVICVVGMVPGIAGITFAPQLTGGIGVNPAAAHSVALISSFILGFFVMSAGPIGFQYAAEVSAPAHESTSQGLLLWVGQLSGMIMVTGMSMKNKSLLPSFMISFVFLIIIAAILIFFIKESELIKAEKEKQKT
ncbi:MAG: MFS transporter [Bacteroidales bacterium]|jgi:MFS family permease|nr:MFS transporter [Bacteroidales bacterium]